MRWVRRNRRYVLAWYVSVAIVWTALLWEHAQEARGYFAVGGEACLPLIACMVLWGLWEATK